MDNSELRKSLEKQIIETTKNFGDNTPNELLQIIDYFGFLDYNKNIWSFDIRNSSNCECRVFLYLLADNKTVRVSIGDYMCSRLENPVDLFETVDYERINNFLSYLL